MSSLSQERNLPTTSLYALKPDGREEEENERLNIQHGLIKTIFDNRVIYAPVKFESGDRILDCGTGTGIWPNEVASLVPQDVFVDGADINPVFFPSDSAENVEFHLESTLNLPIEWNDRYKLVNQRMMVGAFSRVHWKLAFEQHYRVLQPGGWVQIVDLQLTYRLLESHKRAREFVARIRPMWEDRDFLIDGFDEIPDMMKAVGFENITQVVKKVRLGAGAGKLGRDASICMEGAQWVMKGPALEAGAFSSAEAFDTLLNDAKLEWNTIPGVERTWVLFYGQKASVAT